MKKDNKDITINDLVETKQAKILYKSKKNMIDSTLTLINILVIMLLYKFYSINSISLIVFILLCLFVVSLSIELEKEFLKKYSEILKEAIHNDQIRKDEKIRIRERKRLEEEEED